LKIPRERYAKYEGTTDPPLDCLQRISRYFHVSIDLLLSFDIRRVPYENLLQLEENRILLPITVDSDGENKIEIVTAKARAGYLTGYGDPEFVENLQCISLPFLSNGKYRAFPIEGDSMPPHNDKSFIVGKYIEKLADIKEGKTYVVLSRNDGIVYKRIYRKPERETIFLFHSDNTVYKPYEVKANEILEVWEHVCSFCMQEFQPDDLGVMNVKDMFQQLRLEISELKKV
jgi:hypothetical protein